MSLLRDVTTLATLPLLVAREHGAKTALILNERAIAYAELEAQSSRVAHALIGRGVRPADRVAMIGKESIDAVLLLFGTAKAGAVYVGVNWRLASDEIAYIMGDAQTKLIFADVEHAPLVERALARMDRPPEVVWIGEADASSRSFASFCAASPSAAHTFDHAYDAEAPVVQIYTSGTTGHPKGVVLAHRSFFAVARALDAADDPWIGWSSSSVSLLFVPTFHIGGLWWLVRGLALGSTNVVLRAFDATAIAAAIERHRVTKTCMVPSMMQVLLGEPALATTDLSSLETIVYGGSPISETLLTRARATFGCDFCQIYGMTETGNMALSLRPRDHDGASAERLRSAGRPLPGVEARIDDGEGRALGDRQIGEIMIRSPARMVAYWRMPEETARTLDGGWIATGDAGYRDEDGFIHICDRLKDMIICAGENVYPAEIENVLRAHPDVTDAAVIGVPDDLWGEAIKALIVARPGSMLRAGDVIRWVRARIAAFKVPKTIELVETLPRNASGKLSKAILREPYWRGRERKVG